MTVVEDGDRLISPRKRGAQGTFASWLIILRQSGEMPPRKVIYPDGDWGEAKTHIGRVMLDPDEHAVVAIPSEGSSDAERNKLLEWARRRRDNTDFGLGVLTPSTLDGLTQPIDVSGDLFLTHDVVRCTVLGCDRFMGWHPASDRDKEKAGERHVASDLGNDLYRCRLLFTDDAWVLDVGVKIAMRENTAEGAVALGQAILQLAETAAELNMAAIEL